MSSLLRLERETKNSSKAFRIHTFLFRSYSFGIETVNTFTHSRSSLENNTRFQTNLGKVYITRFQTKKAQKPYPLGRYIPIWIIQGSTPGRNPTSRANSQSRISLSFCFEIPNVASILFEIPNVAPILF